MTPPSPETEMVFRDLDEFEAEWPEEPSNPEPRQDEVLPGTEEWVSGWRRMRIWDMEYSTGTEDTAVSRARHASVR